MTIQYSHINPLVRLPEPQLNWALFLDIDGTLLDIAATPDAVTVPDGLPELLQQLIRAQGGAVALVSGRSIEAIDALFAPLTLPAAGQHGAEMRLPGAAIETAGAQPGNLGAVLPIIQAFSRDRPGLLVEYKGMTIAVHCRAAPEYQEELAGFLDNAIAEQRAWFEIIRGHLVFEIKPRSISKGSAVERFMGVAPFAGRIPFFLGDDRTDEDGFAAVHRLNGYGIRVGPVQPTQADWNLPNPSDVRAWLHSFTLSETP